VVCGIGLIGFGGWYFWPSPWKAVAAANSKPSHPTAQPAPAPVHQADVEEHAAVPVDALHPRSAPVSKRLKPAQSEPAQASLSPPTPPPAANAPQSAYRAKLKEFYVETSAMEAEVEALPNDADIPAAKPRVEELVKRTTNWIKLHMGEAAATKYNTLH